MASPAVLTPVKRRSAVFSTRTAGGRMPLTPSPHTSRTQTPDAQAQESIHGGSFMSRLQRSVTKTTRDSPKSNIARVNSPRRLELGVSEWTLTGTGKATAAAAKATKTTKTIKTTKTTKTTKAPAKSKKEGVVRSLTILRSDYLGRNEHVADNILARLLYIEEFGSLMAPGRSASGPTIELDSELHRQYMKQTSHTQGTSEYS